MVPDCGPQTGHRFHMFPGPRVGGCGADTVLWVCLCLTGLSADLRQHRGPLANLLGLNFTGMRKLRLTHLRAFRSRPVLETAEKTVRLVPGPEGSWLQLHDTVVSLGCFPN